MFQCALISFSTGPKALHARKVFTSLMLLTALLTLQSCKPAGEDGTRTKSRIHFDVVGTVTHWKINEISGMETIHDNQLVVINDEGEPLLWLLEESGEFVQSITVEGAANRDWEDLAVIDQGSQKLLAIADTGDNLARYDSARIYFVPLPAPGAAGRVTALHHVDLVFPDGPRDCESLAFDPSSNQLLLLTKRDKPPRLYGIPVETALNSLTANLEFLTTVSTLRPPTRGDMQRLGKDGAWISQPTGMDINSGGNLAAIITYRSLYLFAREPQQTWAQAFQQRPREFLGPGSPQEEAIAFSLDDDSLLITSEGTPVPVYKAALPGPPETVN